MQLPERNIEAFEPILMQLLKGENLVSDQIKLALNLWPGLTLKIGEPGLQHAPIEHFLAGEARRPHNFAEAAGYQRLLFFEIGQVVPPALGKNMKFSEKDIDCFCQEWILRGKPVWNRGGGRHYTRYNWNK